MKKVAIVVEVSKLSDLLKALSNHVVSLGTVEQTPRIKDYDSLKNFKRSIKNLELFAHSCRIYAHEALKELRHPHASSSTRKRHSNKPTKPEKPVIA